MLIKVDSHVKFAVRQTEMRQPAGAGFLPLEFLRVHQEEKLRGDAEADGGAGEQGVARRGVVAQRARHQHQRQHAERKVDDLRGPDGVALQRQRREEVRPDARDGEPRRGLAKKNARQHDRRDDHQREGDGVRRDAEGVELQRAAPGDERDGRAEELHWDAGVIDVERCAAV